MGRGFLRDTLIVTAQDGCSPVVQDQSFVSTTSSGWKTKVAVDDSIGICESGSSMGTFPYSASTLGVLSYTR